MNKAKTKQNNNNNNNNYKKHVQASSTATCSLAWVDFAILPEEEELSGNLPIPFHSKNLE